MPYTTSDIPVMLRDFKRARDHLEKDSVPVFVCHSLSETNATSMSTDLVKEAIAGCWTLGDYYGDFGLFPDTGEARKKIRIRWINKIIRDLRAYQKLAALTEEAK